MAIVALSAAFPLSVAAQQPPHVIFTGKGFIDDRPVADGTVVEAWVRGVPVAATEIFNSEYQLFLVEPPGESFEGEVIGFKLGGYGTDAATGWREGTENWVLLYAYTGLQGYPDGFGGDVTADPEPLDMAVVRELQAQLSKLEQERSEFAAELDQQRKIDIANVTNRWETAIAELRAEVEQVIRQMKRKFELERQQTTFGPRREAILRRMDAELEAFIKNQWVEFEFDTQVKQGRLRDEIIEIEMARDSELNNLNQLIYQVESELKTRLGKVGLFIDDFPIPDDLKNPVNIVPTPEDTKNPPSPDAPHPEGPPDEEKEPPRPETPQPKEPERNRGFFTNSISTDTNTLNDTLDPTTLAVIGILITLVASALQLVKGS